MEYLYDEGKLVQSKKIHFGQREQQVQRPWETKVHGMFKEQKGRQGGQNVMSKIQWEEQNDMKSDI